VIVLPIAGIILFIMERLMQANLLNTPQAAQYLGLGKTTLEKARVYGKGPKYVRMGRAVRYRPADLDAWLEGRVFVSTSEYDTAHRRVAR